MKHLLLRNESFAVFIVFLYSGYSFFTAILSDTYGNRVLLGFTSLALIALASNPFNFQFSKKLFILLACFFALTTASVLFPQSQYIESNWLFNALSKLLFSLIIIQLFQVCDKDLLVFKWGIVSASLSLSTLILLQNHGIPVKQAFAELNIMPLRIHIWNQKYHEFWALFLMWAAVGFLWRKSLLQSFLAAFVVLAAILSFKSGYSQSVKLALAVSLVVFLLAHLNFGKIKTCLMILVSVGFAFFPVIWMLKPLRTLGLLSISDSLAGGRLEARIHIFDFNVSAILDKWFFGYGFGSTLSIPAPSIIGWGKLPGGHPHNLPFLFWIEMGVLGGCLLTFILYSVLSYTSRSTSGLALAPAAWGMIASSLILFSLSFSIWQSDVVLTYCLFFCLLVSLCDNRSTAKY